MALHVFCAVSFTFSNFSLLGILALKAFLGAICTGIFLDNLSYVFGNYGLIYSRSHLILGKGCCCKETDQRKIAATANPKKFSGAFRTTEQKVFFCKKPPPFLGKVSGVCMKGSFRLSE